MTDEPPALKPIADAIASAIDRADAFVASQCRLARHKRAQRPPPARE